MKKLLLIITLIFTSCMFGQISHSVPAGINYQAIIRNNTTGAILSNSVVTLKFDLYNTFGSSINYSETKTFTTNIAGLITHTIGSGSATIGTNIYDVYWEGGDVHYEVTLTLDGTTTTITPKQKFMSVPYALHSADGIIWQGNKNTNIPTTFLPLGSVYRNRNTGITFYKNIESTNWDTLAFTNVIKPYFIQSKSDVDSIPSGILTAIKFTTTEKSNVGALLSSVGFSVPSDGLYHIDASIDVNIISPMSPFEYQLQIMKNDGTLRVSEIPVSISLSKIQNQISADVFLLSGDYIQIGIWHNSTNKLVTIPTAPNWNYFNCHKIN